MMVSDEDTWLIVATLCQEQVNTGSDGLVKTVNFRTMDEALTVYVHRISLLKGEDAANETRVLKEDNKRLWVATQHAHLHTVIPPNAESQLNKDYRAQSQD